MAKLKWKLEGDCNSKFFHACFANKGRKRVLEMRLNGVVHESLESIHQGAVEFFQNSLQGEPTMEQPSLEGLIDLVILEEENVSLLQPLTLKEVFEALSSIPNHSTLGPDGFGSGFYKSSWEVVKIDVWKAVLEFFMTKDLPKFSTASYLVLIPKMESPTGFDKFRPISLCSVFYKICSKIIVSRLTVDMAKAYDRVDWGFLILVLRSPWYSVMMNGTVKGFFPGGRGLRQGDPLSPYLFIIQQEVLSRLIHRSVRENQFGLFSQARGMPIISLLMYADDVMVFSNGSQRRKQWLLRQMGFMEGIFPFKYLGVSIIRGQLKQAHLEDMVNKVPQVTIAKIQRLMSSFFWGEADGRDKRKWLAWNKICNPVEEGGLSIRSLQDIQKALHMRFAWNLIQDINHVLFEGEFPQRVWSFFGNLFGIPLGKSWKQHVGIWFRRASSSSQVGFIVGILPIIVTWRL
ncbi:uncharacterized protein LOC121247322 [Juglans microcarpa x Juglans regia]|uniref:uncharacterized protein LOC121247322 n=1 Tax=Juglans microcarpa x Juglans regia TaxID=2249226 RepID=UPI001B7ED06B|nr:uncharacterized protein LOC121247322 [Juglans microcarpa x Juglans regia]